MQPRTPHAATGTTFEIDIEKLVYGGDGLGRHEGKVVFVHFTAPGDRVEVRPIERKKGFVRAVVTRILKASPERNAPPCPHFGRCGGCQWQHLDYALQVETKRRILEEGFHHRFPETKNLQITMAACPKPYGYRSRGRVQMWGTGAQTAVGFFRYRSHEVEDVSSCPLFQASLNEALASVRAGRREGRFGPGENELEIAGAENGGWVCAEAEPGPSAGVDPLEEVLLRDVGGFVYAVAASVFFQANDFMLGELTSAVLKMAVGGISALDLYSGVGFFSLPLARRYRDVTAVESHPGAHQLCIRNIAHAHLENVRAVCADVHDWMRAVGSMAAPALDFILLDPPRSGAGPEVMKCITEWAPEGILYVSCDPQTLIRDLAMLPARDYRIDAIEGLDLFPQTYHFETVVHLKRR
jgi:23S rRNA (uracil1939-C5)-methyltransferase